MEGRVGNKKPEQAERRHLITPKCRGSPQYNSISI
jgi:hypothetical protein